MPEAVQAIKRAVPGIVPQFTIHLLPNQCFIEYLTILSTVASLGPLDESKQHNSVTAESKESSGVAEKRHLP